jgi:predicted P-loop ATPase
MAGGRRFWPNQCTKIDIAALVRDPEQLWAEAVDAYHRGEKWWLTDDALNQAAEIEQELRRTEDPWEFVIADWLKDPRYQPDESGHRSKFILDDGLVTNAQLLWHAIGKPVERQTTSDQMRVGRILVRLGWEKHKRHGNIVWKQTSDDGDTLADPEEAVSPLVSPLLARTLLGVRTIRGHRGLARTCERRWTPKSPGRFGIPRYPPRPKIL